MESSPRVAESPKMSVKPLDKAGLMARQSVMAGLEYDALNPTLNLSKQGQLIDRKKTLSEVLPVLVGPHPEKMVYVIEEGDSVEGCIIVSKSGGVARVEHLWTRTGGDHKQVEVIGGLVSAAIDGLKSRPDTFEKLEIPGDANTRSEGFRAYLNSLPHELKYLGLGSATPANDNGAGGHDLEKAA